MSGDKERPPTSDPLVRDLLNHAGTRVTVPEDVEEYASDMRFLRRFRSTWGDPEIVLDLEYLRARRTAFVEWRTKWGKFKLAALIAISGAIIAWAVPQILQHLLPT